MNLNLGAASDFGPDAPKPRIHIIELDYHNDVLSDLLELIDSKIFDVICSTKIEIHNSLSEAAKTNTQFNLVNKSRTGLKSIAAIKADLHVFNTMASWYRFWSINLPKPTVIRIHNFNAVFFPLQNIKIGFNFFEWRKAFTHIVFRQLILHDLFHLHKIKKEALGFSFLSSEIERLFIENCPLQSQKCMPVLPVNWCKNLSKWQAPSKEIRIVISGTLEPKRKNFQDIEALCGCLQKCTKSVKLIFAGRVPKHSLPFILSMKRKETPIFSIHYYETHLSQSDFEQTLESADILVFPMAKFTRYKVFREVYGQTKISGGFNDYVRAAKPALVPEFYRLNGNEQLLCRYYHNPFDLASKCLELMDELQTEEGQKQWSDTTKAFQHLFSFEQAQLTTSEALHYMLEKTRC